MAAVSPVHGMMHYEILTETGKGKIYARFLTNLFKHYIFQTKNMIVIQDNCSIHTAKVVTLI